MALNGYNSRLSRTTSSQNGRPGVYHRGLNTLTKLSGSSGTRGAATTATARNLPRPINTSSLKKENGGQDITAVLVNRDGGKKVGWGSSLPDKAPLPVSAASLEPTPADASALVLEGKAKSVDTIEREKKVETKHPPLPPPPTESNKNVPWALHPPSQPPATDARPRSPSPKRPESEDLPFSENGYPERMGDSNMSHRDGYSDSRGGPRYGRPDNRYEFNDGSQRYRESNYHRRYPARNDSMGYGDRERYYGRGDYDRGDYSRGERSVSYGERDFRSERGDYRDRSEYRYNDGPRYEYRNRENFMSQRGGYNHDRVNDRYSNGNDRYSSGNDRYSSGNDRYPSGNERYSRDKYYKGDDRRLREDNYVSNRREGYDNNNRDWRDSNRGRYLGGSSPLRMAYNQNYENDKGQNLGYPTNSSANESDYRRPEYSELISKSQKDDYSSDVAVKDPHRSGNGINRSNELPQRSEEDIVLQTIREREAADSRANSKRERTEEEKKNIDDRQEPSEDYGIEENKQNSTFKPTVILRNNQTSGEASGSDAIVQAEIKDQNVFTKPDLVEEADDVCKNDNTISIISKGDSENTIHQTKIEESNVQGSIDITDLSDVNSEQIPAQDGNSKQIESNSEQLKELEDNEIDQQNGTVIKNVSYKVEESESDNGSEIENSSDCGSDCGSDSEVGEIQPKSRETLRFEQQQKILRQVEATRAKHSKRMNDFESATSVINQVKDKANTEVTTDDEVDSVHVPFTKESKSKTKKPQPLPKKKGPRTQGVLFKRLSDGSIVNADLSEEELAKRAERKIRKNQTICSDDTESRDVNKKNRNDKNQPISEKEISDANANQKIEQHTAVGVESTVEVGNTSEHSVIKKEETENIIGDSDQQSKEFIPSPGPKVSAWKAGPPPGMVKSQNKTQDLPSKSVECSNSSKISDILSSRLVDVGKNGEGWANSSENEKSSAPKYAAVAPIMNSSWNAFSGNASIPSGTIGLFVSTEQSSPAVPTDWSIPTHKSDAAQGVLQWRSTIPQEVDEDETAALTDGSDAVPRDLLSSGAGSDIDCEDTPETKDDNLTKSSKFRKQRKTTYMKNSKRSNSFNQKNDQNGKKKTFTRRPKSTNKKEETNSDSEAKATHRNPSKRPPRKFRGEVKAEKVPKQERCPKPEKIEKSETPKKGRNSSRPKGKFSRKRESGTGDKESDLAASSQDV